jgi:peptide/nickel transport system substrate-binding protein
MALTSTDVVVSLAGLTANGQPVGVRAIDPLTVEIRFNAPFAPGLRVLDGYPIAGFGPFVEEKGRFTRNPNYWRKAADGSALPYLDEIAIAPAPAAEHDFNEAPVRAEDFEAIKKLEQSGKLRLYELGPGLDADALWFARLRQGSGEAGSDDRPWLHDERLRLAISTAVDRREYCKQVFYGACDPMGGPVSPANLRWFNPDFPLGLGNPPLARAMLEEQGLRDRTGDGLLDDATRRALRFTLLIRRDVSSSARAAQFLAATLKTIGVRMDVTPLDPVAFAARRQKGNYDAMYDRIEMRDTDPAMNLDFWLSSGARHVWSSPSDSAQGRRAPADWERQIDQLMLKHAGTFDRAERLQAFIDAQKIYLQHMPAIFFGTPRVRIATSMRTLNATPSPLRPHLLWNAENLAALK